jgi:hypothetical protein
VGDGGGLQFESDREAFDGYEELELGVHLWSKTDLTGILLCYQMVGMVPVGLHGCGSVMFATDFAVDEALRDAHILPSLVRAMRRPQLFSAWRCGS